MVFLVVVVFFEETLGVAVFLTVGFEAGFKVVLPLAFFGAAVFLGLSAASLGVDGFFTTLAVAFLGLSLVEDGFLVVVGVFLVEAGFLF